MDGTLQIYLLLLLPAAGAAGSLVLRAPRAVLAWSVLWVAAYAIAAVAAASMALSGDALEASGLWLRIDALSALHLVLVAAVFAMSTAFAYSYFGREADAGEFPLKLARRFGGLWAGAIAAMTLVLVSNNLGIMWVGVELTTLSTAFLIRLHVTRESLEATWKYLMVCSIGVALAFMGVVLFAASARGVLPSSEEALLWTSLSGAAGQLDVGLAKAGFVFILIGFGTKAGLAPMHTWLPDAHSQAPAPVSAVFSGTLLNAALYCVLRYLPIVEGATGEQGWGQALLVLFGVASVIVAAAFIVFQHDIKRLLAYSSVEHIGIIALACGLGPAGVFAGLFHAFNHSISKASAFFAAGGLLQGQRTDGAADARGAGPHVWRGLLALSLLSLVGAGPFAILASQLMVAQAAAGAAAWPALALLVLGVGMAFVGILRHLMALLPGAQPAPAAARSRRGAAEAACVGVPLIAFTLLALWMPAFFYDALSQAAALAGGAP